MNHCGCARTKIEVDVRPSRLKSVGSDVGRRRPAVEQNLEACQCAVDERHGLIGFELLCVARGVAA
ncbi:MAG: hypothetical protein ACKO2B_07380 [Betaproteobacteria bacterium]